MPIEESFSRLFDISFFLIAVFRRVCLCVGVSWVLSPCVYTRAMISSTGVSAVMTRVDELPDVVDLSLLPPVVVMTITARA